MQLHIFLSGCNAAMSAMAGLFFFRYAALTRDRFHLLWGISFFLLAVNWAVVGATTVQSEHQGDAYFFRLAAFVIIAIAIIDKNRGAPR